MTSTRKQRNALVDLGLGPSTARSSKDSEPTEFLVVVVDGQIGFRKVKQSPVAGTVLPKPADFDCPDCHAAAGSSCRSSRGRSLPTPHTRRLYKAQDAWAKAKAR